MSCESCKDKISGVCKVCALVDGDNSVKTVVFCAFCGVYICNACNSDYIKRMEAFVLAKLSL
jgi:hypothetical protein